MEERVKERSLAWNGFFSVPTRFAVSRYKVSFPLKTTSEHFHKSISPWQGRGQRQNKACGDRQRPWLHSSTGMLSLIIR